METITYTISSKDIILEISGNWKESAHNGNAPELEKEENVIGRNIFDYVIDEQTQLFYQKIFTQCRTNSTNAEIEYRCDSHTHRRIISMSIKSGKNGIITIQNELILEEPFKNGVTITEDSESNTLRCSMCNSLKPPNHSWRKPEELALTEPIKYEVRYTVCPKCNAYIDLI